MSDYTRLIAHAAAKFTGKPALLSPLLDDHGFENKKSLLSSEPTEYSILLNVDGFLMKEVEITCKHGNLGIHMKHCSRNIGANNSKWCRDCKYTYNVLPGLESCLTACWTNDQFLIIQSRCIESVDDLTEENYDEYRLLPINVINVLKPALNIPLLKRMVKTVNDKSSEIFYYIEDSTSIPENMDSLSLLKSIPLLNNEDDYISENF